MCFINYPKILNRESLSFTKRVGKCFFLGWFGEMLLGEAFYFVR